MVTHENLRDFPTASEVAPMQNVEVSPISAECPRETTVNSTDRRVDLARDTDSIIGLTQTERVPVTLSRRLKIKVGPKADAGYPIDTGITMLALLPYPRRYLISRS